MKRTLLLFGLASGLACSQPLASEPTRPTLTLTPAVVFAKVKGGQGWTQTLRMSNLTGATFDFDVEVQDVVVKDGKRTFVAAGETPSSIAASAVVTPKSLVVPPQQQGIVTVTLTIPQGTALRAVVIYFRGKLDATAGGTVGLGASLGALVTFGLSDDYSLKALSFSAAPQTETTNQVISQELLNSGAEVLVPTGATAILDDSGHSVAKATYPAHRLLPGEHLTFSATCPLQLKPGHYRAVSSFEFEGRVITASGEFSVP